MSEHEHLTRLERKLDAVLLGTKAIIHHLLARRETDEMSKLHDDLSALVDGIDAAADRVIAAKTESESSLADVITRFAAVRDKLNAAADDSAASGGSTGSTGAVDAGASLRVDNSAARPAGSTLTDNTGGSSSS